MLEKVGFIGLGLMGKPMARRLLRAGYELVVYNRSSRPVEELVKEGARGASAPKEVGRLCGLVITMLPDAPQVREVLLGPEGVAQGVLERGGGGCITIDMSTASPLEEMRMGEELRGLGIKHLDAPVSGGTKGAEEGSLTIMVGGSEEAFREALPVLRCLGRRVERMGGNGMGSFTKLCNQVAVAINLLGTCEALLLALKAGLDGRRVIEVLGSGAASSWQLANLGPKILSQDYSPGFKVEHLRKDLRIIREVGESLGLPLLGSQLVGEMMKALDAKGRGGDGTQALFALLKEMAGLD